MDNRKSQDLASITPLNPHPASIINRYFDNLMTLTYDHPVLMGRLVAVVGISSLTLALSPLVLPRLGIEAPLNAVTSIVVGAVGTIASYASHFAQHSLFGLPVTDLEHAYRASELVYESAKGQLIVSDQHMPILRIEAAKSFDAGYLEGYMLGEAIKINLEKTNFLYPAMCLLLGAPLHHADLHPYLAPITSMIPHRYLDEMRGKVAGYNAWLAGNDPKADPLSFDRYMLLQLLPDLHNYNPFVENKLSSRLPSFPRVMGCTTISLRLGEYTFIGRVLDWPSHGVAGKYFLQVDRNIEGSSRTIDIGIPLLSGGLTMLNEAGMMVEMNIAYGDKVKRPQGLPAVFFNRLCAEHANNVNEIADVLSDVKPLSAYHLTASDGVRTQSFHFYQSQDFQGDHAIENLDTDRKHPQLMVVANHGLRHDDQSRPKVVNHKDSDQRKQNIFQLFHHEGVQDTLKGFIEKQNSQDGVSAEDIEIIKQLLLQMERVALVCNYESVLSAMFVYLKDDLIDAVAATDNLYAQRQDLHEFRQLSTL